MAVATEAATTVVVDEAGAAVGAAVAGVAIRSGRLATAAQRINSMWAPSAQTQAMAGVAHAGSACRDRL